MANRSSSTKRRIAILIAKLIASSETFLKIWTKSNCRLFSKNTETSSHANSKLSPAVTVEVKVMSNSRPKRVLRKLSQISTVPIKVARPLRFSFTPRRMRERIKVRTNIPTSLSDIYQRATKTANSETSSRSMETSTLAP